MGDSSPSIARTFSQPISYANQEEHCLRALTSSFSFGRYESDLDWGKWSCFTQNRCLEEVQKLSKPGTVAAMKAYFEARYKRVAYTKPVAVLPNQLNEVPTSVMKKVHNNSQMDLDSAKFKANDMGNALKEGEVVKTEQYDFVENSTDVGSLNKLRQGQRHSNIRITKGMRTLFKNNTEMRDLTLSSTRKPAISSSKASIYDSVSKLRAPVTSRKENNYAPNSYKTARDSKVKRRSPLESIEKSLSFASVASEAKKASSPILDSIRNSRIIKSFGKSSKDSSTKQAPTRDHLHGVAARNKEIPHQENISCVESSIAERKTRSSTVFSSFSFQREERGARHKEKLENKLNMKETEKAQLQTKFEPHLPKIERKPLPRQGKDSANSLPPSGSSGKTQIKVCNRKS